jgi:DNA primase
MNAVYQFLTTAERNVELEEINKDVRYEIRASNRWQDVLLLLGYNYFKVSANGRINILCTIHDERTPSLRLWPDGWFYCMGCQWRGDILDFVIEYKEISAYSAVQLLLPKPVSHQLR